MRGRALSVCLFFVYARQSNYFCLYLYIDPYVTHKYTDMRADPQIFCLSHVVYQCYVRNTLNPLKQNAATIDVSLSPKATCTHKYAPAKTRTHMNMRLETHTYICSRTRKRKYSPANTYILMRPQTHPYIHTYIHYHPKYTGTINMTDSSGRIRTFIVQVSVFTQARQPRGSLTYLLNEFHKISFSIRLTFDLDCLS